MNHLFLKLWNLAELSAGRDDQLEFVRRVDGAAASFLRAEDTQHQPTGAPHNKEDRTRDREKSFHGRGHGQSDVLSALQSQSFRHKFAEDHVHVGDQAERDRDSYAMSVGRRVRKVADESEVSDELRDDRFADPAQGEAHHGDAELHAVDDFVEVLVQALDDARADASGFDELLDARVAHADQGEFRGREERIGCHQQKDHKDPEQHKSDHGTVILTF